MNCFGKNSKKYTLTEPPLASGGEGAVYNIVGDNHYLAKIYHASKIQASPELCEKLEYMVNNPPDASVLDQIAWPTDVLKDSSGHFCGFVMPKLDAKEELKNIYPYPPKAGTKINTDQKLVIAINICIVISAIHKAGYVFGDFNPNNIGVNLTNGHVGFFDTDSYHFTDIRTGDTFRCEVACDGYVAPELINHCHLEKKDFAHASLPTFTTDTDNFALAIHIFKLLMNGYTPFNGIKESESISQSSPGTGNLAIERDNYCFKKGNKPQSVATPTLDSLPDEIQILLGRTFLGGVSNPSSRATADEWRNALQNMRNNLVQCSSDSDHMYFKENKKCPYCEASKRYQKALAGFAPSAAGQRLTNTSTGGQVSFSGASPIIIPNSNNGGVQTSSHKKSTTTQQQPSSVATGQDGKSHIILSIFLFWASLLSLAYSKNSVWSLGIVVACVALIVKIVFTVLRYSSIKVFKRVRAIIAVVHLALACMIAVPHGISILHQNNLDTIINTSDPNSLSDSELKKYHDAYLRKAKQLAKESKYQEVIELLATYSVEYEKESIQEKLDEYALVYMNRVIENASNSEQYDNVVEDLSEALITIQDCATIDTSELEAKLNEIKVLAAEVPVYFDEIKKIEGNLMKKISEGTITDSQGNIYLGGNLYEANSNTYFVQNLNREFGKFSMTIASPAESSGTLTLKIIGDETVLYEGNIGPNTEPTTIELDLSEIRFLRFSASGHYTSKCYLIDPVFYRSPNYENKVRVEEGAASGIPLSDIKIIASDMGGAIFKGKFKPLDSETVADSFDNEFSVGEFYRLDAYDKEYVQFRLGEQYERFCFILANADNNTSDVLSLQIVGDETILYEGTVGIYSEPTAVELDIKGVDILTINYGMSGGGACYLVNPYLN